MLPIQIKLGAHALALAALLFATKPALSGAAGAAIQDAIQLTPASLTNGAPILITVKLNDKVAAVAGQWQGPPVLFFSNSDHHTWFAVAGVDVEVTPGKYPLTIDET